MATDLSFADLEIVLCVAEAGSLSEAARLLGVEQSTLSRRLDKLEKGLGQRLFVRGRQGAKPTAAADRLLPHAKAALTALAAARRDNTVGTEQPHGKVRVAAPEGIAEHVLAPRFRDFRARYPQLAIEVVEGAAASDLHTNEADLAIRLFRPTQSTLVAKRLGHAAHGVYGHRDYCQSKRGARLEELDWVSFGGDTAHLPEARWLSRRGITPAFTSRRFTTIVAAVRAGAGVGLLAHSFASLFPELEALDVPDAPEFATDVWLVATPELQKAPHVAPVWDLIERAFAELRG